MAKKTVSQAIVWVILILLIIGLAGFGATNFGGGAQTVATVGDTEVDAQRYARALDGEVRSLSQRVGTPLSFQQAQAFGIDRAVLSRLVTEAALEEETSDIGLSVGDETVARRITEIDGFQGPDGFDRDAYEFALERSGLSVREFEARTRTEAAARLVSGAVGGGVVMPDPYVNALFEFAREARSASYVQLDPARLSDPLPDATEAELTEFYQANPAPYTRPETRVITYAALRPADIADTIDVDDADLRAIYDAAITDYVQPERRLVERLVFRADADADAARARLDEGDATFEDLIAERGLALADVDLGDVSRDDLGAAGDAIFALEEPGVIGPLPSDLGPALFRMNAVLSGRSVPFEDAAPALRAEAQRDQAAREIADRIEDFEDLLAGGATLEELAAETEMTLTTLDWTDATTDGLAGDATFAQLAATAQSGDFPELREAGDGSLFALRLDEVLPPALRPLPEVEDAVRTDFDAQRTADALAAEADALAETLKSGTTPDGLTLETATGLTRDSAMPGAPRTLTNTLFQMTEGEVRVVRDGTDVYLLRLDGTAPADRTTPDALAGIARVSDATSLSLSDDILAAFGQALIDREGVTINEQVLQAVHATLQ